MQPTVIGKALLIAKTEVIAKTEGFVKGFVSVGVPMSVILTRATAIHRAGLCKEKVMPSFDIVSEVDLQEVRNAVDQASRELKSRFDFKGVDAQFEVLEEGIRIAAEQDFQLKQLEDILRDKLARRGVDGASLDPKETEGSGKQRRQLFGLREGIDRDTAKKITKLVKDSKLKVQSQINGEKLRVTGKKRDDLQAVMALLKESKLTLPLQFDNFRD